MISMQSPIEPVGHGATGEFHIPVSITVQGMCVRRLLMLNVSIAVWWSERHVRLQSIICSVSNLLLYSIFS